MIIFPKKIKGKDDRLSITIPKTIADDYGLEPGNFVFVTLKDKVKGSKLNVEFRKRIAKCGAEGTLVYLPKKIVVKHGLRRDMTVWVTLEEFG